MESTPEHASGVNDRLPAEVSEDFLRALREHGVIRAEVFGSVARGKVGPTSDIDLLVAFDRPVSLFEQLRLARILSEIVGRPVDLMTHIHPAFRPYITPTLMPLPL
jgi:predicted nucleotidyltransferase